MPPMLVSCSPRSLPFLDGIVSLPLMTKGVGLFQLIEMIWKLFVFVLFSRQFKNIMSRQAFWVWKASMFRAIEGYIMCVTSSA